MRPWFEKIVVPPGHSWCLFERELPEFPFNWHYHPEFELTLTLNSQGMRFVGDHVAPYGHADLVLLGPNLPHAWQSSAALDAAAPHRAWVCWFSQAWMQSLLALSPELAGVAVLLQQAQQGLSFGPAVREQLAQRLPELSQATAAQRWLGLLQALLCLSQDPERQALASHAAQAQALPAANPRLGRVLDWLHAHYAQPLNPALLADLAHLSQSQLQRSFKRCTRMTLGDYAAQLRIGHACALLVQSQQPIASVGQTVGYTQASHFTRQFQAAKGVSPSVYRQLYRR